MDDITSMWVWIPRYKYVIFNGNNGSVDEQLIAVTLNMELILRERLLVLIIFKLQALQIVVKLVQIATNGSIINGVSTYTHPAFTVWR